MSGFGTNEKELIDVMTHRSAKQRVEIVKKYKTMFGKDLQSKFKSELSGNFEKLMLALCCSLVEFDARELHHAVKGLGTDEDAIIEILCSRTNQQLRKIKQVYEKGKQDNLFLKNFMLKLFSILFLKIQKMF